ncbi:MAG: acyltransferase, partial [Opitutales bacterium]|nr:acyltransferase [Opitutales bacterium]
MHSELLHVTAGVTTVLSCWFIASLLARFPQFKSLDQREKRVNTLDGIRGYLALGVLMHHFILTWFWKTGGNWGEVSEVFANNAGRFGVAVFFMISGFLFIRKIAFSEKVNWKALYASRFFRIVPLYFFAVLLVLGISAYENLPSLLNDPIKTAGQLSRWLLFIGGPLGDSWMSIMIIAGVEWTLRYEWIFYFSLPILSVIIQMGRKACMIAVAICILLYIFPTTIALFGGFEDWALLKVELNRGVFFKHFHYFLHTKYFFLFAVGGIAAWLEQRYERIGEFCSRKIGSFLALLIAVATLAYPNTLDFFHSIMIGSFFFFVVLGADLFGALKTRGSVFLSEISYSIYLLHAVVLYLSFSIIWPPQESQSQEGFMML